ncbi:hypothetical protein [Lentzea sp. CA-135723]|uniref:hypothetical protein n=1 Tax=Lentzea sp. CA-135723 TaxID=3239950 RepID=UPI003D8E8B2A
MAWAIRGEFDNRGWDDVARWFGELGQHPDFASHQHMRDIVASVLHHRMTHRPRPRGVPEAVPAFWAMAGDEVGITP